MKSGDTEKITIPVLKRDRQTPKNLTGADPIKFSIAKELGCPVKVSKDLTDGIVITDAVNGKFQVTLDPDDTADLDGNFIYEAEVTDSVGDKQTVAQGDIIIGEDLITS